MAVIGINNGFAMDNVSDEAPPTPASSQTAVTAYLPQDEAETAVTADTSTEDAPKEKMNVDESSDDSLYIPAASTPREIIYYDTDEKALFSKFEDTQTLYFTMYNLETRIREGDPQALVLQEIMEGCKFKLAGEIFLNGITVGDLRNTVNQKENGEEYAPLIERFIKRIHDNPTNIGRFSVKYEYAKGLEEKIEELERASRERASREREEQKQREHDEQIQHFQKLLALKEAEAAEKEKQNQDFQTQLQEQKRNYEAIAEKHNEYYNSLIETKNELIKEERKVGDQNQEILVLRTQNAQLNDSSRSKDAEISALNKVLDGNKSIMSKSLEFSESIVNLLKSQATASLSGDGSNNG